MKMYQTFQFGRPLLGLWFTLIALAVAQAADVASPVVTSGSPRVAVFASEPAYYINDVRSKIQQNGSFAAVDGFSIYQGMPVPTLAQFQRYDAVLVFSDIVFNNPEALGNVLADYVDAGGCLVMSGFSFSDPIANGYGIEGRLGRGGYFPFSYGWTVEAPGLTLIPDLPNHPILAGVRSFNGGVRSIHTGVYMATNAIKVAHWSDGMPMVGIKECCSGVVVGLNMFPVSSDIESVFWRAETDGGILLANAMQWAAQHQRTPVVSPRLTLWIEGCGTVTPSLGGQILDAGKSYTLKAKPGANSLFVSWQSGIGGGLTTNLSFLSTNASLTFKMQTNLVLQARFAPNYVALAKGSYAGLFSDPVNGKSLTSAGLLQINLTKNGGFAGFVNVQNRKYSVSGVFNASGHALVSSTVTAPVSLDLQMNWMAKCVTGTVYTTTWRSTVVAPAAAAPGIASQNNWIGKYTMILPGSDDPAIAPPGHGYGLFKMNPSGGVNFFADVPDGNARGLSFSANASGNGSSGNQSVAVACDGQWPVYLPLYSGKGLLFGTLAFTNDSGRNVRGRLTWLKSDAAGFTNTVNVEVSPYDVPTASGRVLNATNFTVFLSGGELAQPLINSVSIGKGNKVVVVGANPNKLALSMSSGTGAVSGSFLVNGQKQKFGGAVLQNQSKGFGYFQRGAKSGSFSLTPN